jgi:hypothetical protein
MLLKTTVEVLALTKHLPFSFMIMVKSEVVCVHTIRHKKWRYGSIYFNLGSRWVKLQ